jgi:tRNA nucleotidyltransferase (CCA-adding enzyme)
VGRDLTREMLDRLRFSRAEREAISLLVGEHMFYYTPEWSDAAVRRFLRRVGPENVDDLFALREADDLAHGMGTPDRSWREALQERIDRIRAAGEALRVADLAVDGADVMRVLGIEPGPRVGRALDALLDRVLEDPSRNTRERLLALLAEGEDRLDGTGEGP